MKYGIIAGTMMLLAFVIITGYIDDDSIKRYEVVDCELYGIAYITYLNEDGETATLYIQDWPRVILWDKTYLEYDVDSEEFTFYVHKEGFESLKKAHEENLRLLTIDNDRMEVYNSSDKIEILKKLPDVNLVEINNETYRIGFFNLTMVPDGYEERILIGENATNQIVDHSIVIGNPVIDEEEVTTAHLFVTDQTVYRIYLGRCEKYEKYDVYGCTDYYSDRAYKLNRIDFKPEPNLCKSYDIVYVDEYDRKLP